jgi:transcriptional regulator with XRE-family HTH domain
MVAKREKASAPVLRGAALRRSPLPAGDDIGAAEMGRRVGSNVREMRKVRDLSLDQLAAASGVSRAALSQIEHGATNPSLSVLWKIAVGLGVHFSELLGQNASSVAVLRRGDAQILRSADGRTESRPLMPAGACPWVEAYELRLSARATHASDAHAPGTREVLVVLNGLLTVRLGGDAYELAPGDSVSFMADQPHRYENPGGTEARCHDIVIYTR